MTDYYRYGVSPFEYALGESGGSLQLAIVNAQVKWPTGPKPKYPEALHQFVTWMLQPQAAVRPRIDDIVIHIDKLIAKFSNWENIRMNTTLECDAWIDHVHVSRLPYLVLVIVHFSSKWYMATKLHRLPFWSSFGSCALVLFYCIVLSELFSIILSLLMYQSSDSPWLDFIA